MSTRRDFVQLASAAMFVGGQIRRIPRGTPVRFDRYPRAGDPQLKELADRALDAAKAAGAIYADVRFTLTEQERLEFGQGNWSDGTHWNRGEVGVRALIAGVWGFAASTVWTPDEMARLGHEATIQGKGSGRGRRRTIDWTPGPAVTGTWVAPVTIDPFTVPLTEKIDVGLAWMDRLFDRHNAQENYNGTRLSGGDWRLRRQETTFASTEGSFLTQTHYFADPNLGFLLGGPKGTGGRSIDRLQPCAKGWEVMTDPTLHEQIPQLLEEAVLTQGAEPPDPGRYDIVCDATVVAQLLAQTVGVAAELDRALGYEANAGGTSYLAPPEEVLGQLALGPSFLNVTANRSIPGMAGTTRWDDEGIEPDEYPVITNGIVVGYHTNRELTSALAAWDAKHGRPLRSRGCAVAAGGQHLPLIQSPNLVMAPAPTDTTFDEMVAGLEHGIVFVGARAPKREEEGVNIDLLTGLPTENAKSWRRSRPGSVTVDRQQLNGQLHATFIYEVRKGKRVRALDPKYVEALFRAPELWKNLQALGGPSTQMDAGYIATKGEPSQDAAFGVRACAARFKQIAVTNSERKA